MKKIILLSFSLFSALHCAQDAKKSILNAVTVIKPVQQIILDYLDVPDHHVSTIVINCAFTYALSQNCIATGMTDRYADIDKGSLHAHKDKIELRDLVTGKIIKTVPYGGSKLRRIKISPDSKYICIAQENQGWRDVIDTDSAKKVCAIPEELKKNRGSFQLMNLEFSPDSKLLAACYTSNWSSFITIWNLQTGKELGNHIELQRYSCPFIFSADSKTIWCAQRKFIWHETAAKSINVVTVGSIDLNAPKQTYNELAIKFDASDIQTFDLDIQRIDISPDGRYLITQHPTKSELIDTQKLTRTKLCSHSNQHPHERFRTVLFDQRDNSIVTDEEAVVTGNIGNFKMLALRSILNLGKYDHESKYAQNGKYLIVSFGSVYDVYQNQAVDLDCRPYLFYNMHREDDKKCVIS